MCYLKELQAATILHRLNSQRGYDFASAHAFVFGFFVLGARSDLMH